MKRDLKVGNEIKILTKDGQSYEGILMDCHRGHLSAIAKLGVILTFPLGSILDVVKI
ncbi:MAG: hypothetical protein JNM93_09185 [Bacteriovoracaceae bacterium]|nr:hypothetical protein [Bacteriovoracaceae bacterium]